jgi:hypothetical protein
MMETMGATLSSRVLPEENDIERDTELAAIMNNCIKQWFGRHKSTEAMKQGSANEPMILQRLQTYDWIEEVFEVGMLQSTREDAGPWVAVSPDGLVVGHISSDDGLFEEDESQIMFVEMKSRQSVDTTI